MIVSHKHRFIFFSNPKTGSESVRSLLEGFQEVEVIPFRIHKSESVFYPHMSPLEAKKAFRERGWDFNDYFKFVFTRNPYARLPSIYEMIKRSRDSKTELGLKRRVMLTLSRPKPYKGKLEFKYWLETIETSAKGGGGLDSDRWRKYGTYTLNSYVSDINGKRLVDSVIRLEYVSHELPIVFDKIGLPKALAEQLPHVNKHGTKPYSTYYDSESRLIVANKYRVDIKEFGYKF